jgi:hypothetical protein
LHSQNSDGIWVSSKDVLFNKRFLGTLLVLTRLVCTCFSDSIDHRYIKSPFLFIQSLPLLVCDCFGSVTPTKVPDLSITETQATLFNTFGLFLGALVVAKPLVQFTIPLALCPMLRSRLLGRSASPLHCVQSKAPSRRCASSGLPPDLRKRRSWGRSSSASSASCGDPRRRPVRRVLVRQQSDVTEEGV